MGLRKSDEFKISEMSGRITKLLIKGAEFRFLKGQKPFNKGMKWSDYLTPEQQQLSRNTTYKKGHLPHNTRADGDISLRRDKGGYDYLHIRTSLAKWELLHVHNWKKAFGEIPAGYIVAFKTTDRANCEVENLELITRKESMLKNTIQHYPEELRNTMKTLKKLKRQINGKQ